MSSKYEKIVIGLVSTAVFAGGIAYTTAVDSRKEIPKTTLEANQFSFENSAIKASEAKIKTDTQSAVSPAEATGSNSQNKSGGAAGELSQDKETSNSIDSTAVTAPTTVHTETPAPAVPAKDAGSVNNVVQQKSAASNVQTTPPLPPNTGKNKISTRTKAS